MDLANQTSPHLHRTDDESHEKYAVDRYYAPSVGGVYNDLQNNNRLVRSYDHTSHLNISNFYPYTVSVPSNFSVPRLVVLLIQKVIR